MKTKPGLSLRRLGSRFMIVDGGSRQSDATAIHSLNETAASVWEYCASTPEFSDRDVTVYLIQNYIVDPATAASDARALLDQWIAEGLILP